MCHEEYFADNIKRLRLLKSPHLSQARLANRLGICRSTYANYELGRRGPPARVVFAAADYFKVDANKLVNQKLQEEGELDEDIT